ncbi:AzlD family protein [Pseudomonas sp. SMV71]|uniref:AzlD family protein n=1 Tax=Pseudomonas sp. SMV71 TaxID=3390195 RepID=UPI003F87F4F7
MGQVLTENLTLITILAMALVTYLTRVLGFVMLRNRTISPVLQQVLQAAPGCVLIAVIAPYFASSNPADLIALALTLFAATRLSILPVVLIAIVAAAVLRFWLSG